MDLFDIDGCGQLHAENLKLCRVARVPESHQDRFWCVQKKKKLFIVGSGSAWWDNSELV